MTVEEEKEAALAEVERILNESFEPIRYFNASTKEFLEERGFRILEIGGVSIAEIYSSGFIDLLPSIKNDTDFLVAQSSKREVAFISNYYIKDSNHKSLLTHDVMINRYKSEIAQQIKGCKVVLGEAVDYAQIAQILNQTGQKLFAKFRVRTNSQVPRIGGMYKMSIVVGEYNFYQKLNLGVLSTDSGDNKTFISPLIEPA